MDNCQNTNDIRLPVMDHRLQIIDSRLSTANYDYRLATIYY